MADVEAQSRQPEQVVNEPVRVETQAATLALNEISTQPSKDPLQEAIQRGDNAWLTNGQQKPGELGTADYFFAAARGLGGDKPFTAMSDAEIAAQQMKGLFRTADMRIKNPDAHLTEQGALADGRLQFAYKADKRTDNLATLTRRVDGDVNEINKTFTGRPDGLQSERLYSSSKKQEIERAYDPTKNKEGLASLRSVKEGDKVSITAGFEGRPDGLKKETLNADPTGQTRIKEYADGRREEVRVGKDGKSESKFFDSTGKPMTGEKFQEGQKALEAKLKAEKAAQPEKGTQPDQKLQGEGITLPPLQAGWGPYQALQQLQREGKINLTPPEMKKEAARIRDREFAERGITSFKQNEKLEFYSPKELAERGRTPEKKGPETSTEKPLERNTNVEQRLTDMKKALEPGAPMTPESADMIRRQLSDLTPAEIQRLKAGFDKDNPNALGDAIKDKFGKMNGGLDRHAHRWAEVEGHLNRTGQPGEDKAIKLRVDALEARWAGYDNNRSLGAIQQNTRTTLLSATEEQRKGVDTSLTKLYGQGLSDLYEKGPGKDLAKTGWLFKTEDKFTKAVLDLTTKKGVDARTPEEQAGLLNLALQTRSIDNFREVAGKDSMTEAGRKHFLENGGLDKINEKKIAGRGGPTNVFSEIQRRELEDLARKGEESPVTQFKKAIGVTSNTETALADAVKRVAEDPKMREMYLDGRELSRSKKAPATEKEKQSLEYYNELQKTFKSAHYFGSERKAQNFDSQIANGVNGALSNGRLGELGASNWQHTSDLFKAVEGATPDQLNALFNGARIVDGKPQSDGLTDGRTSLYQGINREANRGRLDGLLDKKVAYGVELGQIADRIKDTPLGKPLDPKTLQELRDKVPAFKGMAPEKMQQVVDGYRVDQAIRSKTVEPSKLSKTEQQQLVAYRNINAEKNPQEAALKGFLQGRETQRNIDGILNAPGDSAGTRDRKMNEYLKTLKPEEARSLDMFRNIRNDAVQTNVKRDLKESLGDAKDQQAVLGALKGATPAEQERIKNDPAYQKEIRDLADRTATNPASKMASKMILDSFAAGKPLSKAENASINALEKVANQDMNPFERQKAVIDSLKESLRTDKDGSLARELGSNEQARKAIELAVGGERKFNTIVKPLLETGMVPTAQMQRIYGSGGPELFKAGILDSTPQGLKHLGSPEGQADRDALLKGLTPEGKTLAEKIIKQGEVKPEDRQRAFVLGYEKQDAAIDQLKAMPAQQRIDMVRNYNKAFGSNLQEDLLKKVDETHKPTVTLLATENQLTGEQSVVRSREAVTNSTSTWLGSQGLKYDSSVFRSLSDLNLADRQYKGQIPPDVMDKRIKDLAANLKNFEGTKEELANMIVEGVVTAAAVAATPFTGGASLTALMMTARIAAMSTGGGLAGSLLKAQLTGNYEHLAGDILKFGALTGANLLGGEALTAFSGLGGRAATRTVEKAFAEPALAGVAKEATPAVREQITKGLADLIQKGYTAGGVTDDAVRGMLNGIQGLSKESREILAKGLTDNLSNGVREISTEGLRGTVDKLSRAGRTVSLDGSAAYIGDVGGELAKQAQHGKVDLGQAIVGGVNSFFMGSAARGTIDGVRAARAGRHQVDRSVPVVVENGPKDVGAARTPKGPRDKEITLDPSEYHWVDDPAGHISGPRPAGVEQPHPVALRAEPRRIEGPPDRLRLPPPERLDTSLERSLVGGTEISRIAAGRDFSRALPENSGVRHYVKLQGQEVPLTAREMTLGRLGDVAIDSDVVSRRHARLRLDGDRAFLKDLDSANGTFVNGKRISSEVELKLGDKIRLGGYEVEYGKFTTARPKAALEINGQRHALDKDVLSIGREGDIPVGQTDNLVSRRHAEIRRVGDHYMIKNNSPNGTLVNGVPVEGEVTLKAGDKIRLGHRANAPEVTFGFEKLARQADSPLTLEQALKLDRPLPLVTGPMTPQAMQQTNDYAFRHFMSGRVEDGYANAGIGRKLDINGRFATDDGYRAATVVDRKNDPILAATIRDAKERFGHLPPKERADALSRYAKELLEPPNRPIISDAAYDAFHATHDGQRVLLGENIRLRQGVCSQQALLVKVLADEFPDMSATYVRGTLKGGNHAWVEFDFGRGPVVFDPRNPKYSGMGYDEIPHKPLGVRRGFS